MKAQLPQEHWVVTVDGRHAFLFECRRVRDRGMHIEQRRHLQNVHENDHEQSRPSLMGGAERRGTRNSSSAHATPHPASIGHEPQEEERRFAREVKEWLDLTRRELGVEGVSVFAAPRFLGLLRKEIGETTDLHAAELTRLSAHELAEHPAVLSVLESAAAAQRR